MKTTTKLENVNVLVSNGGGMDGRDFLDKGGKLVFAGTLAECQAHKALPWCTIEARVIEPAAIRRQALAKLDAVEKYCLGIKPC